MLCHAMRCQVLLNGQHSTADVRQQRVGYVTQAWHGMA
jgi:hypothetical protein